LLDSVVKERLVKSFVSTEARILQQPHVLSSCFSKNFFNLLNHLRFRSNQLLVSGRRILQRSKPLSTPRFLPLSITVAITLKGFKATLQSPAHSTQLSLFCNPSF
jgi:hypothetical protein